MTTWLITRHPGALEWIARKGIVADSLAAHLDLASVQPGDKVVGTLPVHLAAAVGAVGARFLSLSVEMPPESRGRELTADELEHYGARIEEYRIERLPSATTPP